MATATKETLPSWDLSDYYTAVDDPQLERDLADALTRADEFKVAYHGKVASLDASAFADAMVKLETIYDLVYRPSIFAHLLYAADGKPAEHGKLVARTQEQASKIEERTLFFGLELMALDDARADALLAAREVASWRHFIRRQRMLKDHTLSEPEEKVLSKTGLTGRAAWNRMFHEILDHQKYRVEGEEEPLTFSKIVARLHESDRDRRRAAALGISAGLEPLQRPLTFLYNTILLDRKVTDEMRRFGTPMDARNIDNETDLAAVEAMLEACEGAYDICHRYYRLKAKLLGLEKLMDYDRYAPVGTADKEMSYDKARELILEAFGEFSSKMAGLTAQFFDHGWIDAALRDGKKSGAFCSGGVPGVHAYILMNYTGKMSDVKTLAHELGHGVHYELSRRNTLLTMDPTLCLAETASVFGERLVLEKLIRITPDPNLKLSLLCNELEQSFATVFRQVGFTRFEWAAHNARRDEGELSHERLCGIWMETGRGMFGDALELGEHYSTWWSYIPHFIHTPFYCYAYSFGKLLVLALYQLYLEQGKEFVPRYLELLSGGGSARPEELLAPLGVDLRDPGFWGKGLGVLRSMVEQAEGLARQ